MLVFFALRSLLFSLDCLFSLFVVNYFCCRLLSVLLLVLLCIVMVVVIFVADMAEVVDVNVDVVRCLLMYVML